jgi:predicted transcriptional regulator
MDERYGIESTRGETEYQVHEAERPSKGEEGAEDLNGMNPSTATAGRWGRKYRSKYEIIAAIIESASTQAKNKMHLMFDAYLSYTQIKQEYIPLLVGAGLLLEHSDGYFTATERGLRFLHAYGEIRGIVEAKTRK